MNRRKNTDKERGTEKDTDKKTIGKMNLEHREQRYYSTFDRAREIETRI